MLKLRTTIVLVITLLSLAWAMTPVSALGPCLAPIDVPGQGLSCPAPDGGWDVIVGNQLLHTHGPDGPMPDTLPPAATPSDVACVASGMEGLYVIYAYPSDKTSNYAARVDTIRATLRQMNGRMVLAATESGGLATNYRVVCDLGGGPTQLPHVSEEKLAHASNADSFATITGDLAAKYSEAHTKYLVFYDDPVAPYCGQGTLYGDDSASAANANNNGNEFAIVYDAFGGCAGSGNPMHENGHNMGAVQGSAPHTSSAGHCNDGLDTMCYRDGGATQCSTAAGQDCLNTCFDFTHYDCGHNDYFSRSPAAGSYLSNHWNIGSSLNKFLDFGPTLCSSSATVVLYQDNNFGSNCRGYSADKTDFGTDTFLGGGNVNDGTSAIIVRAGYRAVLFEHANYGGRMRNFTGPTVFVGADFNDIASSLHIDLCDPYTNVEVYQDSNFLGGCKAYNADDSDFTNDALSNGVNVNDQPSAIRVKPGYIASLYQDTNYGGQSKDVAADQAFVDPVWNDKASSMRVAPVGNTASCTPSGIVIFYQDINRAGGCRGLNVSAPDFHEHLFSNGVGMGLQVTSMHLHTGVSVTLYSGTNFTGSSATFTGDTSGNVNFVGSAWNDLAWSATVQCVTAGVPLSVCAAAPT